MKYNYQFSHLELLSQYRQVRLVSLVGIQQYCGRHDRDRMVVRFTTTCSISAYNVHDY